MPTYSQNWDSFTSGTLVSTISGWANDLGTTVAVSNTFANSSPNSATSTNTGDSVYYNGLGQLTDTIVSATVGVNASGGHCRLHCRGDGTGQNWYEAIFLPGFSPQLIIRKRVSGSDTNFTLTGSSATTAVVGTFYNLKFSVTGSSPMTLGVKLWPIGGTEPASYEATATDSSSPYTSGYPGFRIDGTASFLDDFVVTTPSSGLAANGVTFSGTTGSGTTVTTTAASGGTAPYTYQFQRAPSSSGVAGTYANVGTAGSALSYTDSGLSASTQYFYRVVVTDSASGTSTGAASSVTTSAASSAVVAGTASLTSTGSGSATVTCTAATGGVAAITYQWYRSATPAAQGTAVSGATSTTLSDTGLTNGVAYYYVLSATDGTTTAVSNQVAAIPAATVYVGLIGDSWNTTSTAAANGSTGVVGTQAAGNILQAKLQGLYTNGTKVVVNNQGVGGTNAQQWITGSSNLTTALANLLSAHGTAGDWTVAVHLGINDSSVSYSANSGGETAAQYQTYMQGVVSGILAWGAKAVILHGPPYIAPLSANHTTNGVILLAQYWGVLQAIAAANPGQVFLGVNEYPYFLDNQGDLGGDHVHPTPADANGQGGATNVATMWAHGIFGALAQSPGRWTH